MVRRVAVTVAMIGALLTGATALADVFRLADPSDHAPEPVNLGIVHVGDVAQQALTMSNLAPADGFSESLNASFGGTTGDATASGSFTLLPAGATDSTSLVVGVGTATVGAKSGAATLDLESDGTGTSGYGIFALPSQTVNVSAQVNEYADVVCAKVGGDGSLTGGGTAYALNFGDVAAGSPDCVAQLSVSNDVVDPADWADGSWTTAAGAFGLSGFVPFAGLMPGDTMNSLEVEMSCTSPGMFTGLITLHCLSENASGYSGAMDDITISLYGRVIAQSGAAVPEPAGLGLVGLAMLASRKRKV